MPPPLSHTGDYITPLLREALPYLKAGRSVRWTAHKIGCPVGTLGAHWWRYRFPDNFKEYVKNRDSHRQRERKADRRKTHMWEHELFETWEDRKKRRAAEKLAAQQAARYALMLGHKED